MAAILQRYEGEGVGTPRRSGANAQRWIHGAEVRAGLCWLPMATATTAGPMIGMLRCVV